jgi:serine/threonine protein kinase/tetratricopeptide (TPR) repeat protein
VSPEKWEKVKDIFDELADSDQFRRIRVLASLDDAEIRDEVERLLANYHAAAPQGLPAILAQNSPAQIVREIFRTRAFEPGSLLLDRFEIRTFLGSGGMGEVYEAFDRSLGELVAVKTIRPSLLTDKAVVQRFRWEVQRARRVSHPNVCRVHELFALRPEEGEEMPFMTMELLPGLTLFDRVSDTPLSTLERTALAVQICRGLQAAHDAGLVHRDLKCANVVLTNGENDTQRAVITDFGLARMIETPETSRGAFQSYGVPGTLQYLAPELIDGIGATRKSDIYALGVILFRMTTRQLPFSNNPDLAASRAERMRPPDPRTVAPDLEDRWAEVILACLQPAPAERPASADQVAARLLGESLPLPAAPPVSRRYLIGGLISSGILGAGALWIGGRGQVSAPPLLEIKPFGSPAGASAGKTVATLFQLTLDSSSVVRLLKRSAENKEKPDWSLTGEIVQSDREYTVRCALVDIPTGMRITSTSNSARVLSVAVYQAAVALKLLPSASPRSVHIANVPLEEIDAASPETLEDLTTALAEYSDGNLDVALAFLQRAISNDPEFALAYVYKAIILSSMRRDHLAMEPVKRALELRSRLSERVRPHAEAVYAYVHGDYGVALARYADVARLYPTEAPLQRHLAQMYTILSRNTEALQHARQAVDLDPKNPQSLMMLVSACEDAGQSAEAGRVLKDAARLSKDSKMLPIAKGYSALLRNKWDEAIEAYELAATKRDLEAFSHSFQIRAIVLAGRLGEAANRLRLRLGVIQEDADRPNEDLYRYWLGQLALLTNERADARIHALGLASREPIPPSLFPLRAAAEIAHGIGDATIVGEVVRKVRRIHEEYSSRRCAGILYQCRALQAAAQGRQDEARSLIEQAEEYWHDIAIGWTAAEIHRQQAHWQQALERYRWIVDRRPAAIRFECLFNWILSNARAGDAYAAVGQPREAAAAYDSFLFHWSTQTQLACVQQCIRAKMSISKI